MSRLRIAFSRSSFPKLSSPGLRPRVPTRYLPLPFAPKSPSRRMGVSAYGSSGTSVADIPELLTPCPYDTGSQLTLSYTPEGGRDPFSIDVTVVEAFRPFVMSQCLLVTPTSQTSHRLPSRLLVKLGDPRFSQEGKECRLNRSGWTRQCDIDFKVGLQNIRQGVWPNYWKELGSNIHANMAPWKKPWIIDQSLEHRDCMGEVDHWLDCHFDITYEADAYRQLHKIQGQSIPRLYGVCSYTVDNGSPGLDPLIATVPGLVLEYVEGRRLDKLAVGETISDAEAERISQGVLAAVRRIRDNLVIHGDLNECNVIVRRDDLDHPVIINLSSAEYRERGNFPLADLDEWIAMVGSEQEPDYVRRILARLGLHNPLPIPEFMEEITHTEDIETIGYQHVNQYVENRRPDWRDKYYERIPDVPSNIVKTWPNGRQYVWQPLKWRIRADAQTEQASADYKWGRRQFGRVPPWSWSE